MKVFISHSSRDKALIREVMSYLPSHVNPWLDEREIRVGEDFHAVLQETIQDKTDFVIVFLDSRSIASEWVQRELSWALEREKQLGRVFVLPVLLEDVWKQVRPEEFQRRNYLRCFDQSKRGVENLANELKDELFAWLSNNLSAERRTLEEIEESLGIISIHPRGSVSYNELYNRISASHSLRIMALSAESLIRFSASAIVAALVENNCEVKLLIAKEGSGFVSEVENLEGPHRQGQIHTEIGHTKRRLMEILQLADQQGRSKGKSIGRTWMGRYDSALRSSLIICDDSWCWMTPNFSPKRAIDSVSLVFGQAPKGLLEDCINHFDAVWRLHEETVEEIIVSNV